MKQYIIRGNGSELIFFVSDNVEKRSYIKIKVKSNHSHNYWAHFECFSANIFN